MGNCTSKSKTSSKPATQTTVSSNSKDSKGNTRILAEREYHNVETSTYVLPKDDQEKDRLHEQHFLIKEKVGGNLLKRELTEPLFQREINVLDVGCGPATWLLELATEHPKASFYGIDIADTFPQAIYPPNLHLQISNVLKPLPFEDDTFDFVQLRLFAVALRESEWEIAFRNIRKVLKPGGLFQVVELCTLINSTDPLMIPIRESMAELLLKKGQSLDIAARLDDTLQELNFEVLHKQPITINLGHGTKADILCGDIHKEVLLGMAPFMAPQMNISIPEYKELVKKAAANMGPTKATLSMWGYIGRRPIDD
ncbi:S-adenosyl-L-methionine-dependent methyltransferase [Umbelopsis sp. PMI_123]|nr:S-adenosyl-L-methionine-dependent methyltransferase [Umbelopsis sp. PMI_123]